MAHTVTIENDALTVNGKSIPLSQVLVAGAQNLESFVRSSFILIMCLFAPVVGMIVATLMDGPGQDPVRYALGGGLLFAAPIIGAVVSCFWAKPWGVTIEIADQGYKALYTNSQSDAEDLAARINQARG